MQDTSVITKYHAHIYYPDAGARARAAALREAIERKFDVDMGRWRDAPVGPHPQPMYQVAFAPDQFAEIVPWLMLNRDGLTILVHPETGDNPKDHLEQPLWLGAILPMNEEFLYSGKTSA